MLLISCSVISDSLRPHELQYTRSLSFTIFWSLLKLMSIESTMPSNHFIQEYRDFKGIKRTLKDNRNTQGTKMWNRERDCWKSDSLRCGCSPLGGEDLAESLRLELFHTCRQAGNTCRFGVSCVNAGESHRKVVTRPALGL